MTSIAEVFQADKKTLIPSQYKHDSIILYSRRT